MGTDDTVFDRIDSPSVAEAVIRQVEDLIVQGVLVEGARLPSERELAAQLDVSRPKLRDALKQLAARGLIDIQHGEGTFVAKLTGDAMQPALIDLYARHGLAFFDYLEYRRTQEGFAARLAAERATPTDRDRIAQELRGLEEAEVAQDVEASREGDVRFHTRIVEASHNTMLIHMMASIYDLTRRGVFYNRSFLRSMDGTGVKLLAQHRLIAQTVLDGDPDAAERAAQEHLDFVEASFRVGQRQADSERIARKRASVGKSAAARGSA